MCLDYLVLDIEGSKIPFHKPWHDNSFLSSIGVSSGDKYTDWFFNPQIGEHEQHLKELQQFFDNTQVLVGHNIKFDMLWLRHCNLKMPPKVWCTLVAEYLLRGQEHGQLSLNDVARHYGLGHKVDEMAWYWNNGYNTDEIPLDIHKEYLKQDVLLTQQIYLKQKELIEKAGLMPLMELTCELLQVLVEMEYNGVPLDVDIANQILQQTIEERDLHLAEMHTLAGFEFNPSSSAQLGAVLFGGEIVSEGRETYTVTLKSGIVKEKSRKCKIKEKIKGFGFTCLDVSKKTGKPSTGKNVINGLYPETEEQEKFLDTLLKYKKADKIVSTLITNSEDSGWLIKVARDGTLHPNFNQALTKTGRLSSSDPNAQNLPRGNTSPLKSCIVSKKKDYMIVNLDLAQIEWRMAAELSQDKIMLEEIYNGLDIHSANAVAFFGVKMEDKESEDEAKRKAFKKYRDTAKTLGFRLLYGGSANGFYLDRNMPKFELKEWEDIIEKFYAKYSGLKEWQEKNYKEVLTNGYMRTISNRILAFTTVNLSDKDDRKSLKRKCSNYPVQSASADLFNCAIVALAKSDAYKKIRGSILMFVHDSIVMEVHKDDIHIIVKECLDIFKNLPDIFEKRFGYKCIVPLFGEAEIGFNYRELTACDENTVGDTLRTLSDALQ